MPPLENAALFVNETEWRFPDATFFLASLGSRKFLLEALGPLNGLKSDERRKT